MKTLNYLSKSENSVAVLLAAVIFSLTYPGPPLLSPLTALFIVLNFINKNINIRINVGFILFFSCVGFYILGMTMNGGVIYNYNKIDLINITAFFLLWLLLSNLKKESYPVLIHKFAKLTVFLSFIVSVISLYKFMMLLNSTQLQIFSRGTVYPNGSSLVPDYNMFVLGLSSGLIMSVYLISKSRNFSHLTYYLIVFITIFSSIIFAGSRRGWVIVFVMLAFLIFMALKYFVTHRFESNVLRLLKFGSVALFVSVFFLLAATLFNIDINFTDSPHVEQLKYRFDTLQLDQVEDSFSDSRVVRWDYAEQLYNEYNPLEMMVGSGFSYLPEFGYVFDNQEENYPHSPIHSALLYSGLLGVLFLALFFAWTLYKALKHYSVFGIYFLLIFAFICVFIAISSNSVFSSTTLLTLILVIVSVPDKKT